MSCTPSSAELLRAPRWEPPIPEGPTRLVPLPPMQRAVLESLCEGKSNPEIARDWGISENTVKTHLRRLLTTLQARDRFHAVALVYRGGVDIRPTRTSGAADIPLPPQYRTQGHTGLYPPAS
jgi:DNA-binding NarL/FixJ family response regulator